MTINNKSIFFTAFDQRILAVVLNGEYQITYITQALIKVLGYAADEISGAAFSKIYEGDMGKDWFKNSVPMKLRKKDGTAFDVETTISTDLESGEHQIVFQDLHKKRNHGNARELEIALNESEGRKDFLHTVLDEQKSIVMVAQEEMLIDVNKAFLEFYEVPSLEYFLDHVSECIGDTFETKIGSDYLEKIIYGDNWINYVLSHPAETHKALIKGHVFDVHVINVPQLDDKLYLITLNDITALEKAQSYMKDSIDYAALIQHSLVPDNETFRKYVSEYFVIWHPKDVVGGDIYLLQELRNNNEMMLMVIDCTGHGVSGAFVTMLVKAIERQIVGRILNSDEKVSPAKILAIFNRSMKHLLKQDSRDSISNAGFDGGILYYNREENKITYAGAKTPLYFVQGDKLGIIPGDRHSIGYKRSNPDYEFTDHVIDVSEDTVIYLGTDGFVDQQGGDGFPFGKGRFVELIREYSSESLSDQQEVFLDALMEHRGERIANDDVTTVCLKFLSSIKGV